MTTTPTPASLTPPSTTIPARTTMRAAYYERGGSAHDVLTVGELPIPSPAPGEVRVRLAFSGINPADVKARRGAATGIPRVVPHHDGAGVIDAVGIGVDEARLGERVWVHSAAWGRPHGTAAEWVVLPAAQVIALPPEVTDLGVGAAIGIPALTAYHALQLDGGVAGQRVLVAGGAGAVGHYAVQMARRLGARQVIATVSGDEKGAIARAAGADVVVNYREDDVRAAVQAATGGAGVDRIVEVDAAANLALDLDVVAPDGRILIYGTTDPTIGMPFLPMILKNVGVRFFLVFNIEADVQRRAIAHLTAMLARGELTHHILARFPLERVADAHELVESGRAVGKVLLDLGA